VNVMEMIAYEKWSPNNPDHVAEVADGLEDFMLDNFSTTCEDKSHEEVAKMLLDLCERAKKGDHSLAEHVMRTQAADWNKCMGKDETQYVDPSMIQESDDEDMAPKPATGSGAALKWDENLHQAPMFDEQGNFVGGAALEKPKKVKEPLPPPEIDEDGFETVQKGRRRR